MTKLDDKIALITGGGRGIGRAIALQLAERGVRVAVAGRSEDQLAATTAAVADAGGDAVALVADLGSPGAGTALARRALDQIGRIDILVNNAAVVAPLGASTGIDPASGVVADPGYMVRGNAYTAGKAALEAHALNLAAELDGTGVTVNVYRPGTVDTAMQAWIRGQDPAEIGPALHEYFIDTHAAGGLITPEASAAGLIRCLSGDETGRIWDVDDPAVPEDDHAEREQAT